MTTFNHLFLKACSVDPKSIEALLLHGMILTSMKKYSDAILQFRRANDVSIKKTFMFSLFNFSFFLDCTSSL